MTPVRHYNLKLRAIRICGYGWQIENIFSVSRLSYTTTTPPQKKSKRTYFYPSAGYLTEGHVYAGQVFYD